LSKTGLFWGCFTIKLLKNVKQSFLNYKTINLPIETSMLAWKFHHLLKTIYLGEIK